MVTKKSVPLHSAPRGIDLYLKRIFALMFGAVGITALAAYLTMWGGGLQYLINFQTGGMSGLYYVLLFGGLALSIWTACDHGDLVIVGVCGDYWCYYDATDNICIIC